MHVYVIEPLEARRSVLRECIIGEGHTVTSYGSFNDVPRMPQSGELISGIDLIIFGPGVPTLDNVSPLRNLLYFRIPTGTTIKQVKQAIEKARIRLHDLAHNHPAFIPPPQAARSPNMAP